ncbi:cellulose binding domain-containing protein [Microtetraspora sp. AC03309]|uniref:cellulose binding domain-containing protein n=1 Tax=Microtetraspora sp. AC03309 TaxID=2779376 RepID=UPI001E55DE28
MASGRRRFGDIVTPSPSVRCDVEYASWSWDSGMTVNVGITDTGSTAIADWRLTFTFPDVGQHVTSGWSAEWSQAPTRAPTPPRHAS